MSIDETTTSTSLTTIAEYSPIAALVNDLKEKYRNVIFDISSPKGMEACRAARAEIREPRYAIEKIRKMLKAPALEYSRRIDNEAAMITLSLLEIENPYDSQIKTQEEAIELRLQQQRKDKQEAEEQARATIRELQAIPWTMINESSSKIAACASLLTAKNVTIDLPDQFHVEAMLAQQTALKALSHLRHKAETAERESERVATERAEEARRNALVRAELEAERAEVKRQSQIMERIEEIKRLPYTRLFSSSNEIYEYRILLSDRILDPLQFGGQGSKTHDLALHHQREALAMMMEMEIKMREAEALHAKEIEEYRAATARMEEFFPLPPPEVGARVGDINEVPGAEPPAIIDIELQIPDLIQGVSERMSCMPSVKYLVVRRDGSIPNWRWFVLGSRDPAASAALKAYAQAAHELGMADQYIDKLISIQRSFESDFNALGSSDPDAPRE